MGEACAAVAAPTSGDGTARQGPSANHQRHPLVAENGGALARFARTVRSLAHGGESVLPLAKSRCVGPHPDGIAAGRCRRLVGPFCRWDDRPGPSACGGGKRGQEQQALGRSRGGFSTKIHLRTDRTGRPITFTLTPGQQHEATQFAPLMRQGAVKGPGRGRPRQRPGRVCADKGYSSRTIRQSLRRRGIGIVILGLIRFDRASKLGGLGLLLLKSNRANIAKC